MTVLRKRDTRASSPTTVVGTVTVALGLLCVMTANIITRTISNPDNITAQTSTRWNHWDTVSGVLGVTLVVLGGVITHLGRHPRTAR